MEAWYVVRTHPRAEEQVERVLSAKGIGVFVPRLIRRVPARAGGGRWAQEPLFPGYLFARFDVRTEQWLVARSAPGVSYVLGHLAGQHREPAAVPDALIAQLRERVKLENARRLDRSFRAGERVRILTGPFQSLEAIFVRRLNASGRVQVLLSTLNRLVPIGLHVDDLQRVG